MKKVPLNMMWGISLHHYTIPKTWADKGSATAFDEKEYFASMRSTLKMEELVTKHAVIMDRYDPAKKVALVVDEWGIWTNVEPGTNPGFLYQQNSMRDALVAATTLNIFNNHCDRVKMANLAQTINVLQSLILTKGHQILLTPTYHVFDLYKVHQDATWLPLQINGPEYAVDGQKLPALNISASKDSNGVVHISLVNLDANNAITIKTALNGISFKTVTGQAITAAKFTDVNSFEKPDVVKPAAFNGAKKEGDNLVVTVPKLSVVVLELK
jgi:alpha-N-arabinofuranosidase